jgi:hypothetical protein
LFAPLGGRRPSDRPSRNPSLRKPSIVRAPTTKHVDSDLSTSHESIALGTADDEPSLLLDLRRGKFRPLTHKLKS